MLISQYTPPTTVDLEKLKKDLGFTGNQMADLSGVAGNNQWRKYTGGAAPRGMSQQMLFYIAAQLTLNHDDLARVLQKMKDMGAQLE